MPVRSSMSQILTRVRFMIQDPAGGSQFFADQDLQDTLDDYREDIRYEALQIAPTILNAASTSNQAATIFADYYSKYQWWESDVVLQGVNVSTNAAWIVLTPTTSDYITGHWTFESNIFTSGTAPGQYPPVFATGKVFDLYLAAAELLQFWAASFSAAYDISVDGQNLRRSQLMTAKITLAEQYLMKAKPRRAKLTRPDVNPEINARRQRLLDSTDPVRGG
jgi:hypothetical protein